MLGNYEYRISHGQLTRLVSLALALEGLLTTNRRKTSECYEMLHRS
jgi:hypothetical protein